MSAENAGEILLVEDNARDAELTIRVLKKHNLGDKVRVLKDGAEALEYVFAAGAYAKRRIEDMPKLILLDLGLPKVDGLEVLRRIKSDERTQAIPVVVLSGSEDQRDIVESFMCGVDSYITKAVDFNAFAQTVAELGVDWLLPKGSR